MEEVPGGIYPREAFTLGTKIDTREAFTLGTKIEYQIRRSGSRDEGRQEPKEKGARNAKYLRTITLGKVEGAL